MKNANDADFAVQTVNFCCVIAISAFNTVSDSGGGIIAIGCYRHLLSRVGEIFHMRRKANLGPPYCCPLFAVIASRGDEYRGFDDCLDSLPERLV